MIDQEFSRVVGTWLRQGADDPADHIVRDVLGLIAANTQSVPSRPARWVADAGLARRSMVAAALVLGAVLAASFLPSVGPGVLPSAGPASPSPTAPGAATPEPPLLEPEIPAGPYTIANAQVRAHVTMPAGWRSNGDTDLYWFNPTSTYLAGLFFGMTTFEIGAVVSDVCAPEGETELVPVGPSVADLVGALTTQVGGERTGPTEVTVGGRPATRFVIRIPSDCPGSGWRPVWADTIGTYEFGITGGFTGTIDIVDIDGRRVVLTRTFGPRAGAERIAELDAIAASIRFEPIADAGPLPPISTTGVLAPGRHELTVDGVRFSFETSPDPGDRGWGRYRSLYISQDAHGGQHAESVIYWTGYPDGAGASICPDLPAVPDDASATELAAMLAAAPGTELSGAPAETSVGGRSAVHFTLAIRERRGCDPGYLFTWDAATGGPMWMTTNPTDTLRVWVVDVDGRLFVIVAGTDNWANVALADEVQTIVESIRFE